VTQRSLVTALSQAFVAFTIEVDNEFESRMPHRTAADRHDPSKRGPWMTSLTYYSNYLRHIPDDGCTARQLARTAGDHASPIASRLHELTRWGYARVLPTGTDRGEWIVTLSASGALARDTWAPLEGLVEDRWRTRFGDTAVDALRAELGTLPGAGDLPLGFPILAWERAVGLRGAETSGAAGLSTLLARTILAMAMDFDGVAPLSLAMTQDLVRVLDEPAPLRELPLRAGVSKEAIAIGVGQLLRRGWATQAGARKTIELTDSGRSVSSAAFALRDQLESSWNKSTGLEAALAPISGRGLAAGLTPHENGWRARPPYVTQTRASLADPDEALPAFPMVSHRGGYPDGC
jgi:hypothetical protein